MIRVVIVIAILGALVGCNGGAGANEPGYEKKDFAKSGPPPQYKGPGQPGGAQSGPIAGPSGN